jgi:chromosome segregation ATPase
MRTDEIEGPKQFDVAFRGYARGPVDEYVARLHEWAVDCEARAEDALKSATKAVGDRVGDILRTAFEAGEQARLTSEKDAAKLLEEAEKRATEVLRFAERRAEQVGEQADATLKEAEKAKAAAIEAAQAEAERSLEEARHRYDAMEQSINELGERKANALKELARLQKYLAGVPEVAPDAEATKVVSEAVSINGEVRAIEASPAAG